MPGNAIIGFAVLFEIDPGSTGDAVLLGGEVAAPFLLIPAPRSISMTGLNGPGPAVGIIDVNMVNFQIDNRKS